MEHDLSADVEGDTGKHEHAAEAVRREQHSEREEELTHERGAAGDGGECTVSGVTETLDEAHGNRVGLYIGGIVCDHRTCDVELHACAVPPPHVRGSLGGDPRLAAQLMERAPAVEKAQARAGERERPRALEAAGALCVARVGGGEGRAWAQHEEEDGL